MDGADGRSGVRSRELPNFLGFVDYHISFAMGLRQQFQTVSLKKELILVKRNGKHDLQGRPYSALLKFLRKVVYVASITKFCFAGEV